MESRQCDEILSIVKEVSKEKSYRIINHISLGKNLFVKYWNYSPEDLSSNYNKWHFYELNNLAPGYFINNVVNTFSKSSVGINQRVWFPPGGKEGHKIGEIGLENR